MKDLAFPLTRRQVLAGLSASAFGASMPPAALAQARPSIVLQAKPGVAALRPGQPDTPVWSLLTPPAAKMRFKRGDELEVTLGNTCRCLWC